MNTDLRNRLQRVGHRQRLLHLWWRLAACWAAAVCIGLGVIALERQTGWASDLALPVTALAASVAATLVITRNRKIEADWRLLAWQVEARYPELDGRLLTAVQQPAVDTTEAAEQEKPTGPSSRFTHHASGSGYLQQRLLSETLRHGEQHDWAEPVSNSRIGLAQAVHWLALALFCVTLLGLRSSGGHRLLTQGTRSQIEVTPGDTSIERGNSLVVLARFNGALPATVDLVAVSPPAAARRIPLVKSLADPMFGGSVPEVASNLIYHIEYAGHRTRDFQVSVFEHPRLERADASLVFPEYTRQPQQRIENTRRVTAITGSHLDLALKLNKPVASARLVSREDAKTAIPLRIESDRAAADLSQFPLSASQTYELRLMDAEGRTNKVQSQFVFEVLTNQTPEIRLTSPRGDLRPSPLEEISFDGTVWDDIGVEAFGLGYALVGQETKFIELGRTIPGKEKHLFHYLLRLEDLKAQPDQLISWFVWADDLGPDGKVRRTTGDLFFGEVRPFDEIFREGQAMDGQGGEQESQQGGQSTRLVELQKQIISATWKLQRDNHGSRSVEPERVVPGPSSDNHDDGRRTAGFSGNDSNRGIGSVEVTHPRPVSSVAPVRFAAYIAQVFGQPSPPESASDTLTEPVRSGEAPPSAPHHPPSYQDDAIVVRNSQAQALEQAHSSEDRQQDPRTSALWSAAAKSMEDALAWLDRATNSPASLPSALAAEQAAYQALLRLQEHEYQVVRSRSRNQRGNSRNQQMQPQLDQLELAQTEDRYETQRQAQAPPSSQRREQLQVMSRLQDLARRQQDLNDRLKELQAALQEARTEQERADIQRRLKRLEEEEQQMLGDVDEVRQRMDQPENQSKMADERRQLDQTRDDVQRAAQAAEQGAASQALAAGTRAQRQLQQLRDQMRKENSSQFADDLREMRSQARELARTQEDLAKSMESEAAHAGRSLSDSPQRPAMFDQLARQKEMLTNLVERATQVSQQAEQPEPLLSRQLYDTVRKFTQDTANDVKDAQDQLLNRGLLSQILYDELKQSSEPDGAKLLELSSEMLRRDFLPEAKETGRRAGAGIDTLKRGVEHAAETVLGDDTEELRLAQQELNQLTDQLQREIARAQTGNGQSNQGPPGAQTSAGARSQTGQERNGAQAAQASPREGQNAQQASSEGGNEAADSRGGPGGNWERLLNDNAGSLAGPLTGTDFVPWSDRLRDVEEMIDQPYLRNGVAAARERARVLRQEFKHDGKKPDWAVVRLRVIDPLVEVRDCIADELARRAAPDTLVPLDRDPVPSQYSELVRRYYEELGKDK